jgi:hypothetical protein
MNANIQIKKEMRAKSPQNLFLDFSAARYQEIIQIQKDKVITLSF